MSLNVPIIDVHRENFKDFWPAINLAIQTASFISIDAELSGLGCRRRLMAKSIEDRYKSIAEVARTRSILSLGLSCFKLVVQDQGQEQDPEATTNKQTFLAQTFNILTLCNEDYMVEPGALAFLVGHGFDFNKQYSCGIPYYRGFDKDNDKSWPTLRLLFNHILAAKKPLTLHNGLVDLIFLYQNVYTDLPPTSGQFVADLSEMYPAGIVDSKYVAEYEARMPASYLEYVFRKSQRDNAIRKLDGTSHIEIDFCQYSAGLTAVEYQSYTLPPDFAERQRQGEKSGDKSIQVCEIYAAHGYCPKGSQCPKSHDPNAILDAEEIILEEKRKRKRRRRNRKNRNQGADVMEAETEEKNGGQDTEMGDGQTEEKRVKVEEKGMENQHVEEQMRVTANMTETECAHEQTSEDNSVDTAGNSVNAAGNLTPDKSPVAGDSDPASNPAEQNGVCEPEKANQSKPRLTKQTGSHRAGFDAFMTGFATAAFMVRFGDREKWKTIGTVRDEVVPGKQRGCIPLSSHKETIIDRLGIERLANKLYLSGKEYPLAIAKSSFTKTSANHKDKMIALEKFSR